MAISEALGVDRDQVGKATFTWIPFYEEAAGALLAWENRQLELVEFCESLRARGLKVSPLQDQDATGARFTLHEIDPFTFFGVFNRAIRDDQRREIAREVGRLLNVRADPPGDFAGIPTLNNQRSWFFSYSAQRTPNDIPALWRVFRLAQGETPLEDPEFASAFDAAQTVRGVNVNLTMGLYWIRPSQFLSLDSNNREYLHISLPADGLTATFYSQTVSTVKTRELDIPALSRAAWLAIPPGKSDASGRVTPPTVAPMGDQRSYWMVGAYWRDSDPPDQSDRFVQEGIWENGYNDRYLAEVRTMAVGDRIAIKSSFVKKSDLPFDAGGRTVSCLGIKAVGTIVKNRGNGKTVEIEWNSTFKTRNWYFYTHRGTVWRLRHDNEYARRLIDFAFSAVPQNQDFTWFMQRWWDNRDVPGLTRLTDDVVLPPKVSLCPYGFEDLIASGVFVPELELRQALDRIGSKKNLIIQGPPGVGKTFLARQLAYALMQEVADGRMETVQFHPSYSYEDFVRGFRPAPGQAATFTLQDGVFYRFCQRASVDPDHDYVFVIDEINRGNLASILGELLMLLEADKRGPRFAVPLVYQRSEEERFHVPENVFVLGMMNLADRSLAMVDYALRRRFGFLTLQPAFGREVFRNWLINRNMDETLVSRIVARMTALNRTITGDPLLGEQYQVGHSFFCPRGTDFSGLDDAWFEGIVKTEIGPLLEEYWFDNRQRAAEACAALLVPWRPAS